MARNNYSAQTAEQQGHKHISYIRPSQLLGSWIEPEAQPDALAEQLARINEQLVIKNQRSKRIWKTIGIIAACIIVANILLVGLLLLFSYSAYENYESTIVTQAVEQSIE